MALTWNTPSTMSLSARIIPILLMLSHAPVLACAGAAGSVLDSSLRSAAITDHDNLCFQAANPGPHPRELPVTVALKELLNIKDRRVLLLDFSLAGLASEVGYHVIWTLSKGDEKYTVEEHFSFTTLCGGSQSQIDTGGNVLDVELRVQATHLAPATWASMLELYSSPTNGNISSSKILLQKRIDEITLDAEGAFFEHDLKPTVLEVLFVIFSDIFGHWRGFVPVSTKGEFDASSAEALESCNLPAGTRLQDSAGLVVGLEEVHVTLGQLQQCLRSTFLYRSLTWGPFAARARQLSLVDRRKREAVLNPRFPDSDLLLRVCPLVNMAFIPLPKAASQSVLATMANQFGHDHCFDVRGIPPGYFKFLVGRESVGRFISAYGEIDGHAARLGYKFLKDMNTTFQDLSRLEEPARFFAFLEDLKEGRFGREVQEYPDTWLPRHAYPVASIIPPETQMDCKIRFERLKEDWSELMSVFGVPRIFQGELHIVNVPSQWEESALPFGPLTIDAVKAWHKTSTHRLVKNAEVRQKIREFFSVDYYRFGVP